MTKYIKVIEGKFEGWSGYLTGKKTKTGNPVVLLHSGKGTEVKNVSLKPTEYKFVV